MSELQSFLAQLENPLANSNSTVVYNSEIINKIIDSNAQSYLYTISDFVRFGISLFNQADIYFGHGFTNSRQEVEHLISEALALELPLDDKLFDAKLLPFEKQRILELLLLRIKYRIPASYLTNKAPYAGLDFYVNNHTLIPRSPIANLINVGFEGIVKNKPYNILDMCTGSGCLAICLAQKFMFCQVDAVDISPEALLVAEQNIYNYGVEDMVFPIQSDLFTNLEGAKYDLIVTNPPYVDSLDLDEMPAEYLHEPILGLEAGDDGLDIVNKILAQAYDFLADDGVLVCEVGNSFIHLLTKFPQSDFNFVELVDNPDSHGIFYIYKDKLKKFKDLQD